MERRGRYTVAAVSGVLFVVVLLVGLYVAPDLVYPEEQVGGVSEISSKSVDEPLA